MSPEKICDPSRGGMGIILNTASMMLIWVNKYSIRMRDPPTICARIIVPPTNADTVHLPEQVLHIQNQLLESSMIPLDLGAPMDLMSIYRTVLQ